MRISINVKYGPDTYPKTYEEAPTFGEVRNDGNLKLILGFGDNTRALVGGVEQNDNTTVPDNCTVVIETRANTKAK